MTRILTVSLVTLGDPGRLTGGYRYHRRMAELAPSCGAAIRFVCFPERPFPLPALAGRAVLRRALAQVDVVVLDSIAAAFLAPWLPRRPPVPLVGSLHQPPGGIDHGPPRRGVQAALDRMAYRRARLLLVASAALGGELAAAGYPRERLRVVPPGRDLPGGAPDRPGHPPGVPRTPPDRPGHPPGVPRTPPDRPGHPPGVPRTPPDRPGHPVGGHAGGGGLRRGRRAGLLCVANWVPRKGILELLEAVAQLPEGLATLHLAGDDRADRRYGARVRERLALPDLAGRVVVHGPLPAERVAALYQESDVFVLPSLREPYGTVWGEAMAAGLPVVGWRAGNLPHLAADGREGLLARPGDVPGLRDALARLAGDAGLRRALGAAAARRAADRPTWAQSAALFFAALREAAAAGHDTGPA